MPVVTVRHRLLSASKDPVAGRTVIAELITPAPLLADSTGSIIVADTAASGSDGWVDLHLVPQLELAAVGSHYRIRIDDAWVTYYCVVPVSNDPVLLATILVDPATLDPLPPELASLYLARTELGLPGGPVPLGQDGLVPAEFLPAGGGGGAVDSVNGQTGDVVLAAADVGAPPTSRQITAGPGLAGGGTLAANVTVTLDSSTQASLDNADTAVQPSVLSDAIAALTAVLATVAFSGSYPDLVDLPAIPDSPDDVGAAPLVHNHSTSQITGFDAAVNALVAAAVASLVAAAPGTLDTLNELAAALGNNPNFATDMAALIGTKQAKVRLVEADIVTGNFTPPNTSGAWAKPGDANGVPANFELQMPAAVGDRIGFGYNAMKSDTNSLFLDIGMRVGSTIAKYLGSKTSSPLPEGDPSWYPVNGFRTHSGIRWVTVEAGDTDTGNVRFVLVNKTANAGLVYASADYRFSWFAINIGPA